jgi:L-ribulose-5-phosphate 4-epimerase
MNGSTDAEVGNLIRAVKALNHLGLMDLRGSASVRLDSGAITTTPRPGAGVPVPADLTIDDLVTLDIDDLRSEGRWEAPHQVVADLEIYRRQPAARAVVHGQPLTALGFAAAGRALAPLTHTESVLLMPRLPVHGQGELIASATAARAFADEMGDRPVTLLPGNGSVAVGSSIAEAAMLTHQVELLAKVNAIAATAPSATGGGLTVDPADSARITAQKAPPADFQDFFDTVADAHVPTAPGRNPADRSEEALRERVVAACHLLYHHGLIEHLEHVSVRLPEGDAFLITPRRHLGRLRPDEIAVVGMDGQWQRGPLAPPPFLWLHRDIFEARPEVDAIVHTHQLYGRALVMAGHEVRPAYRAGATWLAGPIATYKTPDLMFDPVHREGALRLLGDARIMHEASHGTDYLAATVEEATAGALQYERQARLWHLASQLGTPRTLPPAVIEGLAAEEPSDLDWWRYFRSEMPAGS